MRGLPARPLLTTLLAAGLAALPLLAGGAGDVPAGEAGGPSFNRDVRPILADKCFACHGPDAGARKAKLRLDRRADAVADRGGYAAIVPGDPVESELVFRIRAEPEDRMPPATWHKSLSEEEKQTLEDWIAAGAEWEEHWAFKPPRIPDVPDLEGPFVRGPIDALVLAKLQDHGLEPAPEADRITLLRRLHLDLTGLPPTLAEVDSYLADERPGAYERRVEALLASPHYGERMAMGWLDLVRYADTVGYHGDQTHNVSPYRDWVIHAFNVNLPFDEFTRLQLAGDLVEGAGEDGLLASCYNRLLQTSHEGGVQLREYAAIYDADRARNFGSVWLGLTVGCAQCHDHKFDPIEQRDFYRLIAFFADLDDLGHLRDDSGRNTLPTPREPEVELRSPLDPAGAEPSKVMVSRATEPRTIRVLERGNWMDESGEVVGPGVPAVLPPLPGTEGRPTRADLADWLMRADHPLTARVFVNRIWKQLFGRGISRVLDDLGSQGDWPDHPELLDWLAVSFRESGWDVKELVRTIVRSSTYRQNSVPTPAARARDPGNRWFGRQNRWRLEAELVRDHALAVSGLLVRRLGGESGRPYQPDGYYEHLNFPKRKYQEARGEGLYRRGLYTHWQRTFLHPMLLAFDAPTREECTAERPISNTPSAALALLNDPSFVEAARAFAERILLEGGESDAARLRWAFRSTLARRPSDEEVALLADLLARHRRSYAASPADARALLGTGDSEPDPSLEAAELAAWTSVARALFNLHETLTRS